MIIGESLQHILWVEVLMKGLDYITLEHLIQCFILHPSPPKKNKPILEKIL